MCRFCDNLRQQKESNHETDMTYSYRANLVVVKKKSGNHHSHMNINGHYEVNYCPECGKKLSQLRACPFCGQEVAVVRRLFDEEKTFYVVCAMVEGGCGSTSGVYESEEEAAEAWNRRVKP